MHISFDTVLVSRLFERITKKKTGMPVFNIQFKHLNAAFDEISPIQRMPSMQQDEIILQALHDIYGEGNCIYWMEQQNRSPLQIGWDPVCTGDAIYAIWNHCFKQFQGDSPEKLRDVPIIAQIQVQGVFSRIKFLQTRQLYQYIAYTKQWWIHSFLPPQFPNRLNILISLWVLW